MSESENKILTPVKAIRAKCLDCSCGNPYEVNVCPLTGCPLYPYRFGRNPNRKGRELSEEEREALRERLRKNINK